MNQLLRFFVLLSLYYSSAIDIATAQNWKYVGDPFIHGTTNKATRFSSGDVEINSFGETYVAYWEKLSKKVHIARSYKGVWNSLGDLGHTYMSGPVVDIEIHKTTVIAACYSTNQNDYLYVFAYDGSDWYRLGDSLYAGRKFDLLLDNKGVPTLVGMQSQPNADMQVMQYRNNKWVSIALIQHSSDAIFDDNSAKFDLQNRLLVSVQGEDPGLGGPSLGAYNRVIRIDGNQQHQIGDTLALPAGWNQLMMDAGNNPHLAFTVTTGAAALKTFVYKLKGNKWTLIADTLGYNNTEYRTEITKSGIPAFTTLYGGKKALHYCDSGKVLAMDTLNIAGDSATVVYDLAISDSDDVYILVEEITPGGMHELSVMKNRLPKRELPVSVANIPVNFKLYPNPSNGTITIEHNYRRNCTVRIYNSMGTVVYQSKLNAPKIALDIKALPKGHCIVELNDSGQCYVQKIIIQ